MEKQYDEGTYCKFFGAYAKVYTMSDENGNVFYVGCTIQKLENRITNHLIEARANKKSTNQKKNEKIRLLNYKVVVKIVDMIWVTGTKAANTMRKTKSIEFEWILKFHKLGYDLCNKRGIPTFSRSKKQYEREYIGQTFITTGTSIKEDSVTEILEEEKTTTTAA